VVRFMGQPSALLLSHVTRPSLHGSREALRQAFGLTVRSGRGDFDQKRLRCGDLLSPRRARGRIGSRLDGQREAAKETEKRAHCSPHSRGADDARFVKEAPPIPAIRWSRQGRCRRDGGNSALTLPLHPHDGPRRVRPALLKGEALLGEEHSRAGLSARG
jgi:hypothetical protein